MRLNPVHTPKNGTFVDGKLAEGKTYLDAFGEINIISGIMTGEELKISKAINSSDGRPIENVEVDFTNSNNNTLVSWRQVKVRPMIDNTEVDVTNTTAIFLL